MIYEITYRERGFALNVEIEAYNILIAIGKFYEEYGCYEITKIVMK